eukprot:Seg8304.1 transcript_id=Seg8304.1/GoldUCD/mRNA.D3Y31 product="hypothetical protein" protein_id=Seg8304.1/GoldUCD/D3Y31
MVLKKRRIYRFEVMEIKEGKLTQMGEVERKEAAQDYDGVYDRVTMSSDQCKDIYACSEQRYCRCLDDVCRSSSEEDETTEPKLEDIGGVNDGKWAKLIRRVFMKKGKKYRKLRPAASEGNLPMTAVNISMADVNDKKIRDRSRSTPAKMWEENPNKMKRRGAISEEDIEHKADFAIIVEQFIFKKRMDDYGL